MRKSIFILGLAIFGLTGCLKEFDDTSFVPQEAILSWSEPSKSVTKDACTFEITLHSNLPWRIVPTVSWLSVTPDRGLGDELLTVKVAKNRTVEERTGSLRAVVTADQFSEFTVIQGSAEGGSSNTYYVRTNGDPAASGLSWENATTLESAIDQAADGDSILVAAGVYSPGVFLENADEDDASNKTFQIHSNFTLQGGFPASADDTSFDVTADYDPSVNVTTLSGALESGNNAYHVVTVTAAKVEGRKVVLKGFTITGGDSSDLDEGYMIGGVSYNKGNGAGIIVGASVVEIEDCTITGNVAGRHAAGAYLCPKGEVYMTGCRIVSNETKVNAGGIWNSGATLYMNNCSVSNNVSAAQAAGMYSINTEGVPSVSRIYNCTFSGNDCTTVQTGRSGGGAYIREFSDAVFVNCTFYGNKAANGGGIMGYGGNGKNSKLTLISCTFTGNSATTCGGGVTIWNNYNTLNIYNCIVSGNQGPAGSENLGYNGSATNMYYYTTIVGSSLYDAGGAAAGGWTFDPATMLSAFGLWGGKTETCTLVEGATNPACSQGMSKDDLIALGGGMSPEVDAAIFDSDQRGVTREHNTIGAITY